LNLDDLPGLRASLDAHGLSAKKSFGQHFLLDLNITRKIARLAGPLAGQTVLEVGPGPGGLTRALVETDADQVIAVEKDARFLPLLAELSQASGGRLTVLEGRRPGGRRGRRAGAPPVQRGGQSPLQCGTPLLIKWLTLPVPPVSLTLMFQQEVADRITAAPGEDAYGRLAVITAAVAHAEQVMALPARAFTPPPRVESAVVDWRSARTVLRLNGWRASNASPPPPSASVARCCAPASSLSVGKLCAARRALSRRTARR
jgi:16S rRNA (adenine1518-N6/adenine1519-N6)-dimethyltransferase